MEKDGKTCLNAENNGFDQQTACEAPVCCLKYTTLEAAENNPCLVKVADSKTLV